MNRRALLHAAVLTSTLLLASSLAGCGFALRQSQPMPFRTIALNGFASNSPMAVELARALEAQGVAVVESSAQAVARAGDLPAGAAPLSGHVILEAQADQRDQPCAQPPPDRSVGGGVVRIQLGHGTRLRVIANCRSR